MARPKPDDIAFQGLDDELEKLKVPPSPPSPKTFRLLNKTIQTLYVITKEETIVLPPGKSVDVGEEYVKDNHHVKVMVQRGHISLFEH